MTRDEVYFKENSEKQMPYVGKIIGIVGPMFSGKTTSLIQEYERQIIGYKKSILVKPQLDTRYGTNFVATHIGYKVEAYALENSSELEKLVDELMYKPVAIHINNHVQIVEGKLRNVFIDETQFFDSSIINVIRKINDCGIDVYWSGLNQDYRGEPFRFRDNKEHIGYLMAISDEIKVLKAVCTVCGDEATKTFRKSASEKLIELGGVDLYDARCKRHHK